MRSHAFAGPARRVAAGLLLAVTSLALNPTSAVFAVSNPLPEIDRYVAAQAKRAGIPGLAYAVVQGEQVLLAQGVGTADSGPVTPDTVFEIGSLAKSMTAGAILRLRDEGRLHLDDPVVRHLPSFRVADKQASQQVTLRHLLTHSSGLPSSADWRLTRPNLTEADAVRSLSTVALSAAPGAQHAYSNLGYAVLGQVIEVVSGQPYAQYVQEQMLVPLGMQRTAVGPDKAAPLLGAPPHDWLFGTAVAVAPMYRTHPHLAAAGSSAVASVSDMARYLSAWLGHGHFLTAESRAEAQSGGVRTENGPFYALGWGHTAAYDTTVVSHRGGTNGSASVMMLLPEHQLGVVVLGNLDTEAVATIGAGIVRLLMGKEPREVPRFERDRLTSLAWLGLPFVLVVGLLVFRQRRKRGGALNRTY